MAHIYAVATSDRLRDRVAAEVRAWRGRLNMSQADLGRILGISQAQVSARMRGQIEFGLSEIEALAEAFGIAPVDLMPPPSPGVPVTERESADVGTTRRYSGSTLSAAA